MRPTIKAKIPAGIPKGANTHIPGFRHYYLILQELSEVFLKIIDIENLWLLLNFELVQI